MNNDIYDLMVIGGGINGCGIANDAAGRGLKVMLCEKNDLASSTSSNSSKLIHGGLRYLEHYEFRLVKEALAEREVLLKNAPHIIWPLRFILPHQPHLRPRWMIQAGLFLYDHLSKRATLKGSHGVSFGSDSPLIKPLKKGFEYSDGWVDDARLVALNAVSAANNGATIKTQCSCIKAQREKDYWLITLQDTLTGDTSHIKSRMLVNAAGPWVAQLFSDAMDIPSPKNIRLVKGSHIVVPKIHNGDKAYILQNEDNRIVFVIPYENDFSLIGTTDVEVNHDPSDAHISQNEIDYLVAITNKYFQHKIRSSDIVHTFSGVRPLLDDESSSAQSVTRDYTIEIDHKEGLAPLLSVFGGKITTYRKLAEAAVNKLQAFAPQMGPSWTQSKPLPGGDFSSQTVLKQQLQQQYPWIDVPLLERYVRSYGTLTHTMLNNCHKQEDMGVHYGAGLYQCELDYLVKHEWATSLDDVIWRRSKLGLRLNKEQKERISQAIIN